MCQTPDGSALVSDPSQVASPEAHPGKVSPAPIFTPELDERYPTPSTICVETPWIRVRLTNPGVEATMVNQVSDMTGLNNDLGKQATTTEIANSLNIAAFKMLQSCCVLLEDNRIRRILEAEAHLLA
jgi:hypothetical protein